MPKPYEYGSTHTHKKTCQYPMCLLFMIAQRVILTVEAKTELQLGNFLHILIIKAEGEEVNVRASTLDAHTLGNDSHVALDWPTEQDLGSGLLVLGSDRLDHVVGQQRLGSLTIFRQLNEGGGTEWGVGGDLDALLLNPFNETSLLEVWVKLNCYKTSEFMRPRIHKCLTLL